MLVWLANLEAQMALAECKRELRSAEYERDSLASKLAVKEDENEALGHAFAALRQQVLNLQAALVQQGRVLGVPEDKE